MMEEIDRLVDQDRAELERTFAEKHNQLIATTEVFRQALEVCRNRGWDIHSQLWNVGIYMNIAAHDLSVLVMQLHFERDSWTRRQIARHIVLTIYEVTKDMTQLLGKKIRKPLETLGLLPKFDSDLRRVRQPLDKFWEQHQKKLSDVRCMSAAHRDLDGLSLLESIKSINMLEVAQLGSEAGRILNDIGRVVQSILNECSTIPLPEMKAHV
ncbi:hypothetical protein NDI45_24340 [Leptolyngbya sp. GB1-A1]|uniref:hypothetical protein n=1 Tax=Leptolyngbya sp. GB1-A1 TaxID=2933908 RepID=UPI0032996656